MARANLGNLLDVATKTETKPPVNSEATATTASTPAAADPPNPRPRKVTKSTKSAERPARYDQFERIEARLTESQVLDLDRLARTLNKRRGSDNPRITKNTLVRVAVDLLLDQQGQLHGGTETELRTSIAATTE